MTSRAKPFLGSNLGSSIHTRHAVLGLIVATIALHVAACSGDVQDKRTTSSSSASSSSGAGGDGVGGGSGASGGMGGIGGTGGEGTSGGNGGMGSGGAPVDGGTAEVEYVSYNLFTHVPRFVIYKIDRPRNLCFRLSIAGFSGSGPFTIDVTDPWEVDQAEVTNNIDDCTISMGFPPQPQTSANATTGTGTIVVQGQFPCRVDVHTTISFAPGDPWIPASESFNVDALNVDGGC